MPFNIRDWKKKVFMDILQSDYEQDFIGTLTQFINDVGDSRSLDYAIETITYSKPGLPFLQKKVKKKKVKEVKKMKEIKNVINLIIILLWYIQTYYNDIFYLLIHIS